MSSAGEKWRGSKARAAQSGIPDLEAHVQFCRHAEACGIETLLTAFGFHRSDPIALASALGMVTEKMVFMVAVRSGIFSPTVFVQQVNTVSAITNGRICINVVGGHTPKEQRAYGDFLAHDERGVQIVPPFAVEVDWSALVIVYAAMTFVFAVIMAGAIWFVFKISLQRVLRMGEI
ncbi:MAG: LLM class flavin-dependent oxidoreductase [Bacteroidetes bacterium]|nr:LLM class flavin-dependent oxidoreductase [Bacteroidota bacterium]